ncbi:type IV pilus modification PilV family protein [Shewanella youngdeokensis]|uniref:Prepilin-type N-terminal cleavage/methylation domain-containing protein n=1 Tax=Shewanella youngdeokensis TaxID=2999068 RepID=A0ABZ0JWU7_9GAMM|nr:prepilin-type N-terminal cleavage/methylation domain-containing protein [Shewanella sp. DAU334]
MRVSLKSAKPTPQRNGFTLVELVVGMVVISIAFVMMSSMLFPQADRAADSLHRVRSAELAHSILNEIWGKRYDQNTNANGGVPACGAVAKPLLALPAGASCTAEDDFGPDTISGISEGRNDFNDVDDYDGLNINDNMLNSGDTYISRYINYQLAVSVSYYGAGLNSKLVTVDVTTPNGEVITYNAIRRNY